MLNFNLKQTCFLLFILTSLFSTSFAQNNTGIVLKGIIRNTNNEAVVGVTLFLKNGSDGQVIKQTLSSNEGAFLFTASTTGTYVVA